MKYAVIDIGSNTMRTVVYEVDDVSFRAIVNEKEFAELLSYIEDNTLSTEGLDRLNAILRRMKTLCDELDCKEIFCFATASLRYIDNQRHVIENVLKETGISIQLLSGCEESYYDYIGLKAAINLPEAIGFDLGGGSGQVFYYCEGDLVKSCSEPIGTLAMYNKHVKGLFPNSKERGKIVKTVSKRLDNNGNFKHFDQKNLFAMGGTARAMARVHKHLVGTDHAVKNYKISLSELEEIDSTITSLGLNGIKLLSRIIPERLVTFMPGLVIIKEIMRYVGAKELTVVEYGVREGYIIENAINKGRGIHEFKSSEYIICK